MRSSKLRLRAAEGLYGSISQAGVDWRLVGLIFRGAGGHGGGLSVMVSRLRRLYLCGGGVEIKAM